MTDKKDVHLRNLPKEQFNELNRIRKLLKLTWGEVFIKLMQNKESIATTLARNKEMTLCERQSMATIAMLLPMWCENISSNIPYIRKYGTLSKMLCKTYPLCWKLEKLRDLFYSKKEYSMTHAINTCKLPQDIISKSQQICLTKGVSYAGTMACSGCENYIRASKPALVIGNGPSLTTYNHLDLIKEHGFDGDIFCVTAALKKVLDKEIIPKFIGSLDAEEADTAFIDHEIIDKYSDKMTGLFGINVHPTTNERYKGDRLFYSGYIGELESPNIAHVLHLLTKAPSVNTGGNVGTSMWALAISMGYNPIILIGMDLSFPTPKNMKEYYPKVTDDMWYDENKKPKFKKWYNSAFKKQYYTEPVFESYKIAAISWAKEFKKYGITTINCSEQGSLHGDSVISMKFEDYLKNQKK